MAVSPLASILWQNPYDGSTELCRLVRTPSGAAFEGLVLVPVGGEPARVDYRIEADERWVARRADLRIRTAGSEAAIELVHEGDRWIVDGRDRDALLGCVDLDLRVTPATNTLPIRRLGLPVGERAEVRAAWVGFPGLEVESLDQSYERLGADSYRYRAGDFEADLLVDDAGLVVRYGDGYWSTRARSSSHTEGDRR